MTANCDRRFFMKSIGLGAAALMVPRKGQGAGDGGAVPNLLWISAEDISPDLGCYGDSYAVTPNIDRLAAQGTRFTRAFTNAGVCAPVRSCIITGCYPSAIGTNQMRCSGVPPAGVRCFTESLRSMGYFCTNRSKTDYQFASPSTAWNQCGGRAHWRNREEGRPFFSVMNITTSHESRISIDEKAPHKRLAAMSPDKRHDPAEAEVPPYLPDTPLVRKDLARYADIVTLMDEEAGVILAQLEQDGLCEDTIVWFWGDHGRALPRCKRWIYDSGIHIPLIIRVPEKFRRLACPSNPGLLEPGTVNRDLVSSVDFAPTMLSLAGADIPESMHGHAFMGPRKQEPRDYVFAARDRMDEAYDMIRAVRDERFKYIRNFMPHLEYNQTIDYLDRMSTMQEMTRLHREGRLEGPEKLYFRQRKPVEELYDTWSDPQEINNLAGDDKQGKRLIRMRGVLCEWMERTGDAGLVPEPDFDEMKREGGRMAASPAPGIRLENGTIEMACLLAGASIAYRTDQKKTRDGWKLYAGPVVLKKGDLLYAKTCRLGFQDSRVVEYRHGDKELPPEPAGDKEHWSGKLLGSGMLKRLLDLKELDLKGDGEAIPALEDALVHKHGPVRYWAVIGLHDRINRAGKEDGKEKLKELFSGLLDDSSPSVRVASAEALCEWGSADKGLPVLKNALLKGMEKERLFAAISLQRIGEAARPVLDAIEASLEDECKYVGRVSIYTIAALRGR